MFQNIYAGKKVIVTGHTGFKGGWLSLWLKLMGADVYGISNQVPTDPALYDVAKIGSQINSVFEDIRNLDAMKRLFSEVKPELVERQYNTVMRFFQDCLRKAQGHKTTDAQLNE
jgi:CDP-glucose 4,6-dehydratase